MQPSAKMKNKIERIFFFFDEVGNLKKKGCFKLLKITNSFLHDVHRALVQKSNFLYVIDVQN